MKVESFINVPVNLRNLIAYQYDSIVSKVIYRSDYVNLTLFAFDKEQFLSEHTAPFDAFVNVIEGKAQIKIGEKEYILQDGEAVLMPANISHSVLAKEKFKMLLAMFKTSN